MTMMFDQLPNQGAPPPAAPAAPSAAPPNFDAMPDDRVGILRAIWEGIKSGVTAGWAPQIAGAAAALERQPPEAIPFLSDTQLADVQKNGGISGVYTQARDQARATRNAAVTEHPYAYGVGDLAGSLAPMLVAPEARTVGAMLEQGAKIGAVYGAASGAAAGSEKPRPTLSGLITGENPTGGAENIITGGIEGAVTGTLGGFVGALLGAGASKAARTVGDYLAAPIASTIRGWISPEAEAARRVGGALNIDYPQVSSGTTSGLTPTEFVAAKAAGEPVVLADLGGETTRALLRSAANTSPEGRAMINDVVQQRFQQQNDRAGQTIRSLISGGANTAKTAAQLEAEYDAERGGAYTAAYAAGDKPIWSSELERLTSAPSVAQALRGAVSTWKDWQVRDGFGAMKPPVRVTSDGQLQFLPGQGMLPYPNLQLWDYAARNLADRARAAAQAGNRQEAARIGGLETQLKTELDRIVPEFNTARGVAAQYFGGNNAIEAGQAAVNYKGEIRDLQRAMAQMRPAERGMFQEAYADALARKVENMPDSADVTKRIYNSPQERARITAVLGSDAADRLGAFVDRERIFDAARTALGNSTTARQLIEAGLAGGATGAILSGGDPKQIAAYGLGAAGARRLAPEAAMAAARTVVGYVNRNTAKEVARLLTSNDPQELMRGLKIAAHNQRVGVALRALASRVAAVGAGRGAGRLPALQGPGALNAQGDQGNIPGPPAQ
jgi:hypothetical protein